MTSAEIDSLIAQIQEMQDRMVGRNRRLEAIGARQAENEAELNQLKGEQEADARLLEGIKARI